MVALSAAVHVALRGAEGEEEHGAEEGYERDGGPQIIGLVKEKEGEYQTVLTNLYKEYRDKLTMCAPEEFDALYAQYAQEYLDAGYQEVIDERAAAYEAGNSTHMLNVTAEEVDLSK